MKNTTNKNIITETQSRLLYRITNSLLNIDDLNIVLDKATDEIIHSMSANVVSILLLNSQKTKLTIAMIKRKGGLKKKPQLSEFRVGEGVAGLAAQKKVIIYVPDIGKSRIFIGKPRNQAKSLLSVPMVFRKKLIGVLNISLGLGKQFTDQDKEFFTLLATIIAGSIENSRLVEGIQTENSLLNSVIESTREGVIVVDSRGKIVMMNSYLEGILGIKKDDVRGMAGLILSKKIGVFSYAKKIIKALATNKEDWFYDELEIALLSGEKNCFGVTTSFIRDTLGKVNYTVAVARNITAEKKLLQTKNDLISTATHELRTPLTAVKGYLSMIKDEDEKDMTAKQKKYLDRAYVSTERLVNLVEDLLSTLKIDENKVNFDLLDFDLGKVIKESLDSLKSKARSKKININYKYSPIFAYGDPIKLKHVVENLLDNAIKYTRNNGSVGIVTKEQSHNIVVSINDNGVGIPEEYRSIVFDRFTRVSNPLSVKAGGTGLGLYIAKNLIEKQGGRIWLESEHNIGTTFYFTLPASTAFSR